VERLIEVSTIPRTGDAVGVSILWIVLVVAIVLAVLGVFSRSAW
jgi:hypothetical protein